MSDIIYSKHSRLQHHGGCLCSDDLFELVTNRDGVCTVAAMIDNFTRVVLAAIPEGLTPETAYCRVNLNSEDELQDIDLYSYVTDVRVSGDLDVIGYEIENMTKKELKAELMRLVSATNGMVIK